MSENQISDIPNGADYLITGDKMDFDSLKSDDRIPVEIVHPTELVNLLGRVLSSDPDEPR